MVIKYDFFEKSKIVPRYNINLRVSRQIIAMTTRLTFTILTLFVATTAYCWRIENNILIVEKGDNLWQISHALYSRGFDYSRLWKGRMDSISSNPNLIYDGMRFNFDSLRPTVFPKDTSSKQTIINNYYPKGDDNKYTIKDWVLLFLGVILGFLTSMYGSIIFQRWTRFKEIIRDTTILRQNFTGYPIELQDLQQCVTKSFDYWRQIENNRMSLDADGHKLAAKELSKLSNFIYSTMYKMAYISDHYLSKKPNSSNLLSIFQSEFGKIKNRDFVRFEEKLKPDWNSILKIGTHPILPEGQSQAGVTYFDTLGF